jgi:hypothetical protein
MRSWRADAGVDWAERTLNGAVEARRSNVDLLAWFSEDERELCESCGERASVVSLPEAIASFCLACGAVTIDGVRVDADLRIGAR